MNTVAPPRQLKIGAIIDKTLGVIEHGVPPAALYVLGLTVANSAAKYVTIGMGPLEMAGSAVVQFVVGITAAYLLLDAMLERTGLRTRSNDVFFAYFALSILYILGVIAGWLAIIIPGLVIMARWSLASPMMLARGDGVMQALGASWERTKGNEFQIIAALLALYVVPIAVVIASSVMFDQETLLGIVVTQLFSSATSVLGVAMGVALYGLMEGHTVSRTLAG